MSKNTNFFGQSVFGQLISYIDNNIIYKNTQNHKANYYIKRFMAKDHLISMLFCVFAKCSSLREVSGAMLGLSGKRNDENKNVQKVKLRKVRFYDRKLKREFAPLLGGLLFNFCNFKKCNF